MALKLFEGRESITLAELNSLPTKERKRALGQLARQKYPHRKVLHRGINFDSAWEAQQYESLYLRQLAGEICDLDIQKEITAVINGELVTTLTIDFQWTDVKTGKQIWGEAKSDGTRLARDYPLRKRLIEALYQVKIIEFIQKAKVSRLDRAPKTGKGRYRKKRKL